MHLEATRVLMLCRGCFLLPKYCCCDGWIKRLQLRHKVFVYMHHNEWYVASLSLRSSH
jgi:DTW domain-containing protein YfiP